MSHLNSLHSVKQKIPVRRKHPSRAMLKSAIERSGLKIIGWDVMITDLRTQAVHYYDATVEMRGKQGLILVVPKHRKNVTTTIPTYLARQSFARDCGLPFVFIMREYKTWEMQYQLELWKFSDKLPETPNWTKI